MRRYTLSVEVKLQETIDPPDPITVKPGGDPMEVFANMANRVVASRCPAPMPGMFHYQGEGLELRKHTTVSVANFTELAQILIQFENLLAEIEVAKIGYEPSAH